MSKKRVHDSIKGKPTTGHIDRYAAKVRTDTLTRVNSGEILQNQSSLYMVRRVMPTVLSELTAYGYVPLVELISPIDALQLRRRESLEETRRRFTHGKIGNVVLTSNFTVEEIQLFEGQLAHKVPIVQDEPMSDIESDQDGVRRLLHIEDNRASTLIIPILEGTSVDKTTEIVGLEFEIPQSLSKAHIISAGNIAGLYQNRYHLHNS